jgi:hypothetical protein
VAQGGIPWVLHAAALAQALPPVAALRLGTRLPPARRWVVAWCLVMLASDAAQLWARGAEGNNNNLWVQYIAVPLYNVIMLWALSLWQEHPVSRLAFRIAIPIFIAALVTLMSIVGWSAAYSTVAAPFQSLLLLASALYTLVRNAVRDPGGVTRHDWFWVTLGVSLFYGLRVALPPFAAMLVATHPDLVRMAYFVQAYADIAAFLLIARGILCPLPPARFGGFF